MLPPRILLSYYLKAMRSTLIIVTILGIIFFTSWWTSNIGAERVFQIVQLQELPENLAEWMMFLSTALLKFAPIFGFIEFRTLSEEEKMELKASAMDDHIILVGLGHLGKRVASLLQRTGQRFVVIVLPSDKGTNEELDELIERGIPVIFGDASLSRTLRKANIEKARVLLITIDDDLTNSIIAEKAKELNPKIRVVARVFRDELANMLKSSGDVDVTISTTLATSQLFLAGALYNVFLSAPPLAPVKVEKGSNIEGKSIKELKDQGISVLGILTEGGWVVPEKDRVIERDDVILIQI